MATLYIVGGIIVLLVNAGELPNALSLVFTHAFTPSAAEGGFAGAAVWAAIRFGVARGVFSNEAGLGSAPIAHRGGADQRPRQSGSGGDARHVHRHDYRLLDHGFGDHRFGRMDLRVRAALR